jgi:hypothetical protein
VVHDSTGDRCAEHPATVSYGLHRSHYLGSAGPLQQVTAGAHAQGSKHGVIVGEHREHQDSYMWAAMGNAAGGLDATHPRHIKVHDHHVRLQLNAERHRLPSIGRLADYIEALRSEGCSETVSIEGVIVGDQHA